MTISLSKSKLLSFRQCSLKLWNEIHHRDLVREVDSGTQFRFDEGTRVGEMARLRYPDGRLIDAEYWDFRKALVLTREALDDPAIPALFEAAFEGRRTRARNDILIRINSTDWEMWEVKAVGTAKEVHFFDLAVQKTITEQWAADNGYALNIVKCGIVHLNKEYVFEGGEYDVQALFSEYDCTDKMAEYIPEVEQVISEGLKVADGSEAPLILPGAQCSSPYRCPFSGTACELPSKEELKQLYRLSAKKLEELKSRGISRIEQLSESDPLLSEIQSRTVSAWKTGETQTETTLNESLQEIGYPRYHLDFETISPILPRYKGTRPFQTIPFQFSVHTEFFANATAAHHGCLHEQDTDPRRPLAVALLEALEAPSTDRERSEAPILCYSPYEKRTCIRVQCL